MKRGVKKGGVWRRVEEGGGGWRGMEKEGGNGLSGGKEVDWRGRIKEGEGSRGDGVSREEKGVAGRGRRASEGAAVCGHAAHATYL